MTDAKDPTLYRPNVGLAVFHATGLVFLGKRLNAPPPFEWQMPQGGVDAQEAPLQAAYRELQEEIGVEPQLVDLLEQTPDWLAYDFPPEIRSAQKRNARFLGQRQKWFAFRFKGRDSDIRLDAHDREFSDWRWAPLETTPELVIPFKRATYETIAQRFQRYAVGI